MEIKQVQSKRDLENFIKLPYNLYKNDTNWVAPLRAEQWAQFDPRKNPMLDHCDYALFLALENGKVAGRISAFIMH